MRPAPSTRADDPAPYSTDIAAAWKVVDQLRASGWSFSIEDMQTTDGPQWRVALWHEESGTPEDAFSPNAATAICLAALQASKNFDPSHPRREG